MKPSFLAYIDESGDEGFVFNEDGSGSSRWFVLSAAVIRQVNDLQMVKNSHECEQPYTNTGQTVFKLVFSYLNFRGNIYNY